MYYYLFYIILFYIARVEPNSTLPPTFTYTRIHYKIYYTHRSIH